MREVFMYFGIISIRHLSIHSIYFKIFVITTIRHYSRLEFRAILFFAIILLKHRWAIQFRKCLISLIARNWMARIVSYHHDSENWCLIKWYPCIGTEFYFQGSNVSQTQEKFAFILQQLMNLSKNTQKRSGKNRFPVSWAFCQDSLNGLSDICPVRFRFPDGLYFGLVRLKRIPDRTKIVR